MNYRYIAVEGNIGSGKTTLAQKLAAHYNAQLILEEFQNNPFLEKFYKEPARYAFPLELSFLADRYQQLKTVLPQQDLFADTIISDYIFPKTKIFAKNNLDESEYELFSRMADILRIELQKPDLLIYLECSVPKLQQNIKARGRAFEQEIEDSYLQKLDSGYQTFLKTEQMRLLRVDVNHADLREEQPFQKLIRVLESDEDFTHKIIDPSS